MELGTGAALAAWRRLAGAPTDGGLRVVVDPESPLARRGWIGVVAIGDAITASVPRPDHQQPVHAALAELAADELEHMEVVIARLSPGAAILGPAFLFYPPSEFAPPDVESETAGEAEIARLLAAASDEDRDECGLDHIESAAFVARDEAGAVASACGYRRWPNGVAHISVLTHPDRRGRGHAKRAAGAALASALAEGLLPQWRARPIASQQLALTLGLARMGVQLSVQVL